MNFQEKLNQLKTSLNKERPDMLVSLLKAIGAAGFAFTFMSGLIFTVIPLLRNMYMHMYWHFVEPINQWIAAEPVTGGVFVFLFKVSGAVLVLWFFRRHLMFIPTWFMAQVEKAKNIKKPVRKVVKKVTPTPKDVKPK